jgi:hypothetical protein
MLLDKIRVHAIKVEVKVFEKKKIYFVKKTFSLLELCTSYAYSVFVLDVCIIEKVHKYKIYSRNKMYDDDGGGGV